MELNKLNLLQIDEGTYENPFVLTESEVEKLYQWASSNDEKKELSGVCTTETGTILSYKAYQIEQAFPKLIITASRTETDDWKLSFFGGATSASINEGESVAMLSNIVLAALDYKITDVSLTVTSGAFTHADIEKGLKIDLSNGSSGTIEFAKPSSNAAWLASISLAFYPKYYGSLENAPEDKVKHLTIIVRAIAVEGITVSAPTSINIGEQCKLKATPYPATHTKSNGLKYGYQTVNGSKGTLVPQLPDYSLDGEATFVAPAEASTVQIAAYLTAFGSNVGDPVPVLLNVKQLFLTASYSQDGEGNDVTSLKEGEQTKIIMGDYLWGQVSVEKEVTINSADEDIDEETILSRLSLTADNEGNGIVSLAPASDNSTYDATVRLTISVPNSIITIPSVVLEYNLKAVGLTSVVLSTTTFGVGFEGTAKVSAIPSEHTKGNLSFGLSSSNSNTQISKTTDGYSVGALSAGKEIFTAVAYMGALELLSSQYEVSIEETSFTLNAEADVVNEGGSFYVETTNEKLGFANLQARVEIIDVITDDESITKEVIASRIHINDDNTISVDQASENAEWTAAVSMFFIAKYATMDNYPCSANVVFTIQAKKVTGMDIYCESMETDHFVKTNTPTALVMRPLPLDNTKRNGVVWTSANTSVNSSIMNTATKGVYNWLTARASNFTVNAAIKVFGVPFSATTEIMTFATQEDFANAWTRSVVIEESSNPKWTLGGSDDAIDAILNKYGTYVIDADNKKFARLSSNNHMIFADGTPWDGQWGDAFRRLPRVYYEVRKNENDKDVLYVSLQPIFENYWEETWIGTYKGYVDDKGKLRSQYNRTVASSRTMSQFWAAAQLLGKDFGLVNYFDHCMLNALHLTKYGDANSDNTMGTGSISGSTYNYATGATALLGDDTGHLRHSAGFEQCKLFGIEALGGQMWEFRPNIRFSGVNAIVYTGNAVSNTVAEGAPDGDAKYLRTFQRDAAMNLNQSYITKMRIGPFFDMIAIAGGGSNVTYWCDGSWSNSGGQLLIVGGGSYVGSVCGLSATYSYYAFSVSYAAVGARLAFKGDISKYEPVSGAELASLH